MSPAAAEGGRGQTETVGFVLIIGLVLLGSALVVGLGAVAIGDTEERLTADRAEMALMQFDSKASLVALNQSNAHDVAFGSGPTDSSDLGIQSDRGWMRVTLVDNETGDRTEMMNVTLGALVYEGENAEVAYQGGGVWRSDQNGGQVLSTPALSYRNDTLSLPAVVVSGDGVIDSDATVVGASTETKFPDSGDGHENPVGNSTVNVTVSSEFYRGWGEFFEERTDGTVSFDDENERVNMTTAKTTFLHITQNEIRVDN